MLSRYTNLEEGKIVPLTIGKHVYRSYVEYAPKETILHGGSYIKLQHALDKMKSKGVKDYEILDFRVKSDYMNENPNRIEVTEVTYMVKHATKNAKPSIEAIKRFLENARKG